MSEFIELKKKALYKYFSKMNDMQKQAVFQIKGPLLVLAGAGSGKTTVLVNRIANMIYFGNAYHDETELRVTAEEIEFLKGYIDETYTDNEKLRDIVAFDCVNPWNILAITFTNKAAGELKERISNMLGNASEGVVAATFHSACVRILRRESENIGYSSNFTIYDADDSLRLVKACMKELDISEKMFAPRSVLTEISRQKDKMVSTSEYFSNVNEVAEQKYNQEQFELVEIFEDEKPNISVNTQISISKYFKKCSTLFSSLKHFWYHQDNCAN